METRGRRGPARWGKWHAKLGKAVVDGGNPITGYTIIKAKDIGAAAKLSKGCPILKSGGSIEVCETVDVM